MEDKKKAIFISARKLFSRKGFKDTGVSEIAEDAGIGVGTFYNYYSSKEELFSKVLVEENIELKHSMFKQIDPDEDLVTVCSKMMKEYIDTVNSNRIIGEWYNRELSKKLERYFCQENGMKATADSIHTDIAKLIKEWKSRGKIRKDLGDDLIMAILFSVAYVDMHKTEIGIQHFPQIISLLYQFIMKGLTEPENYI
ncbi:MAG: TetR/AcrR family transcriptional regulator [Dehalococcoidales bacterium]|nr:TetR/AcrR family transcriptional regulator [Dehalococcoidales bacterium]